MSTPAGLYSDADATGGTVGGKMRRRPMRRAAATPYDRPQPPPQPAPAAPAGGGWISKLVDPASRLITVGASRIFHSFFGRRPPPVALLPPPSPAPDVNHQSDLVSSGPVAFKPSLSRDEELRNARGSHTENELECDGIGELEQLLMHKTFTREEVDRLEDLMRSRTIGASTGEVKQAEPQRQQPEFSFEAKEEATPMPKTRVSNFGTNGVGSTSAMVTKVLEDPAISPCELAKSYMGTRPLKISPSTLGWRSQLMRGDPPASNKFQFTSKPSNVTPAPKFTGRTLEDGYLTPKMQGRSAIYSTAHSPYARLPSPVASKKLHVNERRYARQSLSLQQTPLPSLQLRDRQMLKRQSLALDNNAGYSSSIRRVRQKSNLIVPSKDLSTSALGNALPIPLTPVRSNAATFLPLDSINRHTLHTTVPLQSSLMAKKIFSQLETMTSSPKAKSSEIKLAMARREPPSTLTANMLNERALKSLEEVESPNLETVPSNDGNFKIPTGGDNSFASHSSSQTNRNPEENGKLEIRGELKPMILSNGFPGNVKASNSRSVISESINAGEDKLHARQAFQMSVSEDSMEDDDTQNADIGKTVSADVNKERISDKTSLVPFDSKNDGLKLYNGADTTKKAWNTAVVAQKETGIILPNPCTSTSASEPLPVDQELSFNKNEDQKEGSDRSHVLSIDDEGTDKSRISVFSSSANNVSSTSEFKFDTGLDAMPGSLISSVAFENQSENTGSDENGKNEKEVGLPRPAVSPIVSGSLGTSAIQDRNNVPPPSSTSAFSVPSTFPSGNGSTSVTFSSASVDKSATISSSGEPVFKFAPTSTLSSNIFAAASGFELTSEERKSKLASPFSSFPTSTVTLSNTSGFGLSTHSAGTNSLLSGSSLSHGSSSASSVPSTSSLFPNSESASFVKASGSQFGVSSASAPTFGLFISSSSGSLATVFQASAPAAKSSASDTCFGTSSSIAFGSGSALSSSPVSSTSNIFGVSSTQLNSNSTGNSFSSSAPVSATASSSLFGSNSQIASSTNTVIFSSSSQSSGSGSTFGSHSQATASNNLFGSGSQLAAGTSLLGSGSQPASSTGLFGSSSQPASSASLFGSQPATSTASTSPSSTFGLKPDASPVFGAGFGSSTSPSSGFSFSSSGNGALAFGSTSTGVSSGSSMFFNSSTASSSSFPAQSSVFSMSNQPVSFGSTAIQNDQMNVEDSMAEDTVQASNGIPNPFGQVANAPSPNTSPFVFGSPAVSPGAPVFQFGGHQNAPSTQPSSLFSPPGGEPTGSFSLGTGGSDKSNRRIVKVRRDKPRKK